MPENERLAVECFGLKFPNPVGLAAGFDKDAKLFDELSAFGFGFIEIGTLTPVGQPGNPQPTRMQRDELSCLRPQKPVPAPPGKVP